MGKCYCNFLFKWKCLLVSNVIRGFKLIFFFYWIIFDFVLLGLLDWVLDYFFVVLFFVSVYYWLSEGWFNNIYVKGKGNGFWCFKFDDIELYL